MRPAHAKKPRHLILGALALALVGVGLVVVVILASVYLTAGQPVKAYLP